MIKKNIVSYTLMICMVLSLFFIPGEAYAEEAIAVSKALNSDFLVELKAKSVVLMDAASGGILVDNNSHEQLPVASVTKVMSMLLIMEALDSGKLKYDDIVTTSEHAYSMGGSQVYLEPGEEFTARELLKAVAVHSANDGTVALAEKVAGSEEAFVAMMNKRASELGMKDTHFIDCTGLTDEGHYSTAYDIALMSRELIMNHPTILEFTGIWNDTFRNGEFRLDNTNKLINTYKGANGLKTGFTNKAGYCLSASAKRDGMQLIAVVLGLPDSNTRFKEAAKLLDYGFASFELADLNKKGEEVKEVEVKKGLTTIAKAIHKKDVKMLVNKGEKEKIQREVVINEEIVAPIEQGQKIGEVIYKVNDKEIGRNDLIADRGVEKASFFRLFFRMLGQWFGIGRA